MHSCADIYQPKVIGMMWSMLAQMQTWFGNEAWKSYGIQLMPITPASELRDTSGWLREMLPDLEASCKADTGTCDVYLQQYFSQRSDLICVFDFIC